MPSLSPVGEGQPTQPTARHHLSDNGFSTAAASDVQAGADAPGENELIRKVRPELRDVDKRQFTPLMVSIGPYHSLGEEGFGDEPKKQVAEEIVIRLLVEGGRTRVQTTEVTTRLASKARAIGPYHSLGEEGIGDEAKKQVAEEIIRLRVEGGWTRMQTEVTTRLASKARACYPDLPNMPSSSSSSEFSSKLLLDGLYVLSFLVNYGNTHRAGTGREGNSVMRDILFLLENQIPWFVLKEMHGFIRGDDRADLGNDLEDRVRGLLEQRLYIIGSRQRSVLSSASGSPSHLLHLVHCYFVKETAADTTTASTTTARDESGPTREPGVLIPSWEYWVNMCCGSTRRRPDRPQDRPAPQDCMGRWRRATEYCRCANVQLKPRDFKKGVVESVLDVHLEGRTLWIPTLWIDDHTWTILRNLMALEEQMQMPKRPVTAYCVFISQVACKVEDVELLQRAGVLQHFLANDDEVVQGFAMLCKEVVFHVGNTDMNYLNHTWHKLQKRCQKTGNNFIGSFVEMHCGNPVQFFAFLIAFLLFACQVIQVVIQGLSYHKQK